MCSLIAPAGGWTERFRCCQAIVMAARHHKRTCNEPDCGVSIYDLQTAIGYISWKLDPHEWTMLHHLIRETDWT